MELQEEMYIFYTSWNLIGSKLLFFFFFFFSLSLSFLSLFFFFFFFCFCCCCCCFVHVWKLKGKWEVISFNNLREGRWWGLKLSHFASQTEASPHELQLMGDSNLPSPRWSGMWAIYLVSDLYLPCIFLRLLPPQTSFFSSTDPSYIWVWLTFNY